MDEARIEAAMRGDIKFIGKPCRVCGNTTRYTKNGVCVECALRASRQQRKMIKDLMDKGGACCQQEGRP